MVQPDVAPYARTRLAYCPSCRYHTGACAARMVVLTVINPSECRQRSYVILCPQPVSCAKAVNECKRLRWFLLFFMGRDFFRFLAPSRVWLQMSWICCGLEEVLSSGR